MIYCYDPIRPCYSLDRADELHGKHTVFGRCIGDTVFSEYYHLYAFELPLNVYSHLVKMW